MAYRLTRNTFKLLRQLLSLCLLLLLPLGTLGQGNLVDRYTRYVLDLGNGLPHNFVDDITEDSHGFIWICTNGGGLVRYDGYTCQSYGVTASPVALRSNTCRNAVEDRYHRLWIAFEEGVSVLDLQTMDAVLPQCATRQLQEKLTGLRLFRQPTLRTFADSRGAIWIAGRGQVHRVHFDDQGRIDALSTVAVPEGTAVPQGGADMPMLDDHGDGQPLIGLPGRVCRLIVSGNHVLLRPCGEPLPNLSGRFVMSLLRYHGYLWIGTDYGLFTNDPRYPQPFYHNAAVPTSLAHNFVSSLAVSPGDRLLVGTLCGVDIFDDRTSIFDHWSMASDVNPLTSNFVNCMMSHHGQVWVGTETGGVVRLVPRLLNVTNYLHRADDPTSLSPNAVNAMLSMPDGTLLVGTVEGGLNILRLGNTAFQHLTTDNSGLRHNSVSMLTADGQGRVWIGTWGGGVGILTPAGTITPLTVADRYAADLNFIGAMAYDAINQGMWIGTNNGLYFYDLRAHRLVEPFPGCRNIRGCIGSIVTRRGELFVGHLQGMVMVPLHRRGKGGQWRPTYYTHKLDNPGSGINEKISCFHEASDGTLWLGSNCYGIYRMRLDANGHRSFEALTAKDGLANNSVKGITEDINGNLWIATVNGLSELNPQTKVFTNYTEQDGLASSQFYWNGATTDHGGTLYFGSEDGLVAIHSMNHARLYAGQLRLTQLLVDNQPVLAGSRYLKEDIAIAKRISLHESDNSVTLVFSALNYGGERQGSYVYRLRGLEDEWVPLPAGEHSVRYSRLPSGHYTFEVRYLSNFSRGKAPQIAVAVDVAPYFYKSWWFMLLVMAAVVALVIWGYRRRMAVLRNQEAERLYRPIEAALKESGEPGRLQTRIQEILSSQKYYRESQRKSIEADVEETTRSRHPFMKRVVQVLEQHYSEGTFGVAELCEQLGMSQSGVAKRLNGEVGMSTSKFIREYRLDIARRIMTENPADRNITEIAYRVGFNDPKYFTRCFKARYGVAPTEYK